jgi:transcriptional regulator with XRE-family HTH domain
MSLPDLAEQAGISKSYIWNLENKPEHQRPSAETLYALAKALGTTMAALLGRQVLNEPTVEIEPEPPWDRWRLHVRCSTKTAG